MLIAAVALTWTALSGRMLAAKARPSTELTVPSMPVSLDGAALLGQPTAPLVLMIFSDYDCPYCARFEQSILPSIKQDYVNAGLVQIAFWNFPLAIHPNARRAAESAECAGEQGHFWEMHAKLFQDPRRVDADDATISEAARNVGLDLEQFRNCRQTHGPAAVASDLKVGTALGIKGTPAFFIGHRVGQTVSVRATISGARPYQDFRSVLDSQLKK
ncbi:MAG TPA: thioredoxin domain-containing protein [Vicinamibacterales bacterium]|nr:thioredoxin domain-containing protein [Vicinamibacterales bacterium]